MKLADRQKREAIMYVAKIAPFKFHNGVSPNFVVTPLAATAIDEQAV